MGQILIVIISFILIPILIRLKFKLSYALLISSAVLGILSGGGIQTIIDSVVDVFVDSSSLTTILSVAMVSILGGLMKQYKILEKIVDSMLQVINNKKVILMIIPAMIGLLVVPGGALLSAPFVNKLGEDIKITTARRSAINLVFRHAGILLLPYSTSLLIVAGTLPQVSIPRVLFLNLLFVLAIYISGYFLYLRDIKVEETVIETKNLGKNILNLLFYTSPVYISVIIYALTGLPFYITLIASVVMVYFIGNKEDFLKHTISSFDFDTVLAVIAILFMKGIIIDMDGLVTLFNELFFRSDSLLSIMLVLLVSSSFFGLISGSQLTALAVVLPMISQLNIGIDELNIYTFFIFGASFLGYYFSPLHLCQVFTVQHMKAATGDLYKEYKLLFPILLLVLIVIFFIVMM